MTATIQCPAARHYGDVRRLIHHIVRSFVKTRGGDYDNYLSVAHEAYIKAARSWDESKGTLPKRVAYCVYRALLSEVRRLASSGRFTEQSFTDLHREAYEVPGAIRNRDLDLLEGDAALAVEVALTAVPEWKMSADGARELVVEFLLELGWTPRRVGEAFEQVWRAIA